MRLCFQRPCALIFSGDVYVTMKITSLTCKYPAVRFALQCGGSTTSEQRARNNLLQQDKIRWWCSHPSIDRRQSSSASEYNLAFQHNNYYYLYAAQIFLSTFPHVLLPPSLPSTTCHVVRLDSAARAAAPPPYTRSRFYLIRAYAMFDLVVQTKLRVNKRARSYLYRCKKVKLRCELSDTKKVSSYMISHIDISFPKYTSIIQKYWYFFKSSF